MKKAILVFLFITLSNLFSFVYANTNHEEAKQIIENWFASMKTQDTQKAASYLAPQFVSIHTDGMVRDRSQEMTLIKNLHMNSYELSDFHYVDSANVLVVTFKDKGLEKIDDKNIGSKPAGRMAVLQKQGNKWLILAYANLDSIGKMR